MSQKYSHLIWLGANTATEPANLLSCAQQVTLFEAREAACLALQKQYSEPNIAVINALVTATNQTVNFTEYNLPEFSATQPASGLTKFFPGLKTQKSEQQNSLAIADAISKLSLSDDNNLLVVDIPDSNLTLLKALETSKHLSRFKTIYIQASHEPLYTGAASHEEIVAFMQKQGFLPQAVTSSDPDLPWLSFIINPLWKTLQQTKQKNSELEADQAKLKAQLNAAQEELLGSQKTFDQKNLESTKQLQSLEQKNAEQKQQLVDISKQKQEAEQQLTAVQQELTASKKAAEKSNTEQKQLLETEQQLATVKQQLSTAQQELIAAKQAAEQAKSEHKQLLDTANKLKQEIENQLEQTQKKLDSSISEQSRLSQLSSQKDIEIKNLHAALAEANEKFHLAESNFINTRQEYNQQIQILQTILKEKSQQAEQLNNLEAKISDFAKNITGHFDKQLNRTSQKIQNNINLQSYMQNGSLPLFTDATFSSELALFLAEQLASNNYDIVIEFGGGSSTAFIAQNFQKKITRDNENNRRLGYNNTSDSKDVTLIAADEFDLPKRMITLEHSKSQYDKIATILASNHLEKLVHLVHAPLVDYNYCGSNYLFYDCEESLRQISKAYDGRSAKILVLVSGPPVKAGIGAKVPALPALLNVLGRHSIDLLLCAYDGNQTAIIEQWSNLLDQRDTRYKKEFINSIQGCALLSIENR